MTDILLVGSPRFKEWGDLIYGAEYQSQLWDITKRLMKFMPDAIAVELPIHSQALVDEGYSSFHADDYSNLSYIPERGLSSFDDLFIWGQTRSISHKDEIIQLAYRLGKVLGHERVYAIDVDKIKDELKLNIPESVSVSFEYHTQKLKRSNMGSIREALKHVNSEDWSEHIRQLYAANNMKGAGSTYEGAQQFAQCYTRSLKIMANLQTLCEKRERIFTLCGAYHLFALQELIRADKNLELFDARMYL